MDFLIDSARGEDASALAHTLLSAWLQTYPNQDAGIDHAWIRAHRGDVVTSEGIAQWQEFIEEAERQPARRFCRVVRHGDEIVGFLCGRRDEAISLGPMYLLQQAQGRGIGRQLMATFLAWADDAPIRLWVTAYNERAISFYETYDFEDTGERHVWRDKLPNLRMIRHAPRNNEAINAERLRSGVSNGCDQHPCACPPQVGKGSRSPIGTDVGIGRGRPRPLDARRLRGAPVTLCRSSSQTR